jgi:hypothetical protein
LRHRTISRNLRAVPLTEGRLPEAFGWRSGPGRAPEMRRPSPVAGTGQFPVFGRCGARCMVSQTVHRAAPGLRLGVLRPPARSWLTDGRPLCESAAAGSGRKARPGAGVRTPRWSAERRARKRHLRAPRLARARQCERLSALHLPSLRRGWERKTGRGPARGRHEEYGRRSVG